MPGIKVLLVEDDWIIAKEISYNLQDMGFEVAGCFDNGEEAYRQIKLLMPDLVILDIDLAGEMTGIELGALLKKDGNTAFIFLTALADLQTVEKRLPRTEKEVRANPKLKPILDALATAKNTNAHSQT